MTATITIETQNAGAIINPNLHGHFIEHLGACVYDGLWVGEDSSVPNIGGLRRDVVEAWKRIAPPVIRWPGGCFADDYHWEDGVGSREKRPRRAWSRWGLEEVEDNSFGTHEFLKLCRLVGAQPWLGGNLGSGTPRELRRWVEYCNCGADSTLAKQRAENGSPQPFGVQFWGIGNESWDCGGKLHPQTYADEYKRFESFVAHFRGAPPPFLIACGPDGNKAHESAAWTRAFLQRLYEWREPRLHGYDAHFYTWNSQAEMGTASEYSQRDWYQLLHAGAQIESLITEQRAILDEFDPRVGLVIGEWGVWNRGAENRPPFWQQNSVREAVIAAMTLDTFHRHADKVVMANLAQSANVLHSLFLTDGDKTILTPTYHVFDLYQSHKGGRSVPLRVEAEEIVFESESGLQTLPRLSGSASLKDDVLTLSIVNGHASESLQTEVRLGEGFCIDSQNATARVLAHETHGAHNTFETPQNVTPREISFGEPQSVAAWRHVFAPASVTLFEVPLRRLQ